MKKNLNPSNFPEIAYLDFPEKNGYLEGRVVIKCKIDIELITGTSVSFRSLTTRQISSSSTIENKIDFNQVPNLNLQEIYAVCSSMTVGNLPNNLKDLPLTEKFQDIIEPGPKED